MPALRAAAKAAHDSAAAGVFGVQAKPAVDFARLRRHLKEVMAAAAPGKSAERLAGLGVRVVSGVGRFVNRNTVAVDGTAEIKARRFVIATGSSPSIPPIPGLDTTPYFTGDTLPDLTDLPSHLIIIGGGSTGVELAQAFRRLGSRVSLIAASRPLAGEDQECARIVLDALEREGVAIHLETAVEAVRSDSGQIEITLQDGAAAKTIAGSHLLLADRVPAIENLGLEAAGIACGPLGIAVDTGLRTMNRRVYAIGEAAGAPASAHVANYHARLVIGNALFRLSPRVSYDAVARATYTDPQLAHVGLTDEQAKQQGYRDPRAALAVSRERPCEGRADERGPCQGGDQCARPHSRRDHRRGGGRRVDRAVDARDRAGPQHSRHGECGAAPSDAWRGKPGRGNEL